jgi:hypothetical protein
MNYNDVQTIAEIYRTCPRTRNLCPIEIHAHVLLIYYFTKNYRRCP